MSLQTSQAQQSPSAPAKPAIPTAIPATPVPIPGGAIAQTYTPQAPSVNFVPAVDPFGGFAPAPAMPFPSLSKKMKEIHSLRAINGIKLTRKEIETILPPLKNLRNAEKTAQTQSEKAMEEEKQGLLEALPDDPDPINSLPSVQIELDRYRQTEQKTWREIEKAIGGHKTNQLKMLLGHFPMEYNGVSPYWNTPVPATPINPTKVPRPLRPGVPGSPSTTPIPSQPAKPATPAIPGAPIAPTQPLPEEGTSEIFVILQDPNIPLAAPTGDAPTTIAPAQTPAQAPAPAGSGFGGKAFAGQVAPNAFPTAMWLPSVHINLGELIDLLEQKLNAMKK